MQGVKRVVDFREFCKEKYDIDITDPIMNVAQQMLDGRYTKESSLGRMVREYAVAQAKEGNSNDTDSLAQQIRTMSVRSNLYKMLKRELGARGWWKNRPRGKPGSF
jgi:hypothetical protein